MRQLLFSIIVFVALGYLTLSYLMKGSSGAQVGPVHKEIRLVLADGGSILMKCPVLPTGRAGGHGVECYLLTEDAEPLQSDAIH